MSISIATYKKGFKADFVKSRELIVELIELSNKIPENVKTRQEFKTTFETFDQKVNQLFIIISTVVKNKKEMENSVIRNIN